MEPLQLSLTRLSDKLEQLEALQEADTVREAFEKAASEVERRVDRLKPGIDTYLTLQRSGSSVTPIDGVSVCLSTIAALRERLAEEPLGFKREHAYAGSLSSADSLVDNLKSINDLVWEKLRSEFPRLDSGWVAVMRLLPGAEDEVSRLEDLHNDLAEWETPPRDPEQLEELRDILNSISTIVASLEGRDFPESVQKFLRLARGRGAQVEHLTDEVRSWLVERDLLRKVLLRFDSTGRA